VLFPNGIIGYLISRKYKIPQVHSEHWSRINHFLKSDILKRYGKKAMENSEYILPVSNLLKLKIEESLQNLKYEIIPNIIDSKLFTYNPKTKNNITRFLAVGNWQKPKNPFYFLNALCILYNSEKLRNFELTIVGEGKFISKIKSTKYPFTINFIGKVNPDKTVDYFQKSDFLLHGSDFETFSVVIIESLLTGTPVIASNIGIASEVINETNGFICEEENDWVRNIELAVKKEYNHKEISEQLKGKFDEEVIGLRIKSIYDRILNYYL
jgi:glycosyltransferase involved in cell wall biosynthesis